MQLNEIQKQKIIKFFDDAHTLAISGEDAFWRLDNYHLDDNNADLIQSIKNALIDEVREFNNGFVYHYDAMQYLTREDPSLSDSLALAAENGFDIKDINSELLASLHWMEAEANLINNFDFKELIEIIKNKQ